MSVTVSRFEQVVCSGAIWKLRCVRLSGVWRSSSWRSKLLREVRDHGGWCGRMRMISVLFQWFEVILRDNCYCVVVTWKPILKLHLLIAALLWSVDERQKMWLIRSLNLRHGLCLSDFPPRFVYLLKQIFVHDWVIGREDNSFMTSCCIQCPRRKSIHVLTILGSCGCRRQFLNSLDQLELYQQMFLDVSSSSVFLFLLFISSVEGN